MAQKGLQKNEGGKNLKGSKLKVNNFEERTMKQCYLDFGLQSICEFKVNSVAHDQHFKK